MARYSAPITTVVEKHFKDNLSRTRTLDQIARGTGLTREQVKGAIVRGLRDGLPWAAGLRIAGVDAWIMDYAVEDGSKRTQVELARAAEPNPSPTQPAHDVTFTRVGTTTAGQLVLECLGDGSLYLATRV